MQRGEDPCNQMRAWEHCISYRFVQGQAVFVAHKSMENEEEGRLLLLLAAKRGKGEERVWLQLSCSGIAFNHSLNIEHLMQGYQGMSCGTRR